MTVAEPPGAPAAIYRSRSVSKKYPGSPTAAILTGGGDRPYALGLAGALLHEGLSFDFIGSDDLLAPEVFKDGRAHFLNLRGDQNPKSPVSAKIRRLISYYLRLFVYSVRSEAPIFHLLWNNKFEWLDRTLVMLWYRVLGKKTVLTLHNVNTKERDNHDSWFNRKTLRFQYQLADHLFVHTARMREQLLREFEVDPHRVSVIPFGINDTVPKTALTTAEARARLGLAEGDKALLFFGNIARYKGLDVLVDAFLSLRRSDPKLRLVIAGRPKGEEHYWSAIEKKLRKEGTGADVISKIEYVPDEETEVYFKAADVLVLPYRHIFQSGVLFLGYNFGLPAIVSSVGSLQDEVTEGANGFHFANGDTEDLARAIKCYFASDLYRQLAARRGEIQARAKERYSWAKVGAATKLLYRQLQLSR